MPDPQLLEDQIRRIIIESLELNLELSELAASADLREDFGLDSAALFDLVTGIEEQFGFEVGVDDITLENFATIARLARFVSNRTGSPSGAPGC